MKQVLIPFYTDVIMDSELIFKEQQLRPGYMNLSLGKILFFGGKFQQPMVSPSKLLTPPEKLETFYRVKGMPKNTVQNVCPHFFTDDRKFECIWNNIVRYTQVLQKFRCVLSPDFSMTLDMPLIPKLYNSYRNKFITAYWQYCGLEVIPAPSWGDLDNLDIYLDGWPKESMIAINSTGVGRSKVSQTVWLEGYKRVIDTLRPTSILRYGIQIPGEYESISTYYVNNNRKEMRYGC